MVVRAILADVLTDIYDSLIIDFCTSLAWTGFGLESLRRTLLETEVDTSPLFEFSFGQVMPLLLLLVFALTALEVGSIIEPIHKEAPMPDALAARGFGLKGHTRNTCDPNGQQQEKISVFASPKDRVRVNTALEDSAIIFLIERWAKIRSNFPSCYSPST
ncbi:hypothetical protein D7B24_000056 [Verticillium nonalfalfae]|uniref:Uncharacterized protein n=1 Tax=Verticillium nonalfalfae TaxID=1051616 RepID=A0A3M9YKS9_9PEZI|nr:uncharacterized protein D7B24_000056 [Verticillium nonalfalfae]RNJ61203.1 hypothetical protein D7B24_000056 [Verticillium nonalfalfae]